jgi:glycerol-3-phosphate dehydrogenase (NAD(P)+)
MNLIHKLRLKKRNIDYNQIAVIGGGSWATALIKIFTENKNNISWWLRNKQAGRHIKKYHHNPHYLSNVYLNKRKIKVYDDLGKAMKEAKFIVIAIPAAFVKTTLLQINPADLKDKIIVSAVKGIIPEDNLLVTELLEKYFNVPSEKIAVIAGPCHAEEVALEKQSYLSISSTSSETAQQFANLMNGRYIKTTINNDVYGVEYCAVMKNIIALACGITHGLNYGDNFQAVLVSNAMKEMRDFVKAISPIDRDLNDSAYLGDLLVTAYSQFSRNRTFGNMIGRGYTVQSAQMEMNMIAEGYYAVKCIYEINQEYGVNMPICEAVYKILYEKIAPDLQIQILKEKLR